MPDKSEATTIGFRFPKADGTFLETTLTLSPASERKESDLTLGELGDRIKAGDPEAIRQLREEWVPMFMKFFEALGYKKIKMNGATYSHTARVAAWLIRGEAVTIDTIMTRLDVTQPTAKRIMDEIKGSFQDENVKLLRGKQENKDTGRKRNFWRLPKTKG